MPDLMNSNGTSETDNWLTPKWLLRALEHEFGKFDLDPCAEPGQIHSEFFDSNFTPEVNGLEADWFGNVYCNPPYSQAKEWILRGRQECKYRLGGETKQVVFLMPVRSDTFWWHLCLEEADEILFFQGRIRFDRPDGQPANSPRFPSAVIIFRNRKCNTGGPIISSVSAKVWKKYYGENR